MLWSNHQIKHLRLAFALGLSVIVGIPAVYAQELLPRAVSAMTDSSLQFRAPDMTDRGRPGDRNGGGSRGPCPIDPRALYALTPEDGRGLTMSDSPSFWFRVPYQSGEYDALKFQLKRIWNNGKREDLVYEKMIPAAEVPVGIISVALPVTASLQLEPTYYEWSLAAYCNDSNDANAEPTEAAVVFGSIVKVKPTPELQQALKTAPTDRDRVRIYAENGLWYDSLTLLGNLNRNSLNQPELLGDWQALLQSVKLGSIATEPLVACCNLAQN
ncbi:MAG: DUF928 domain-containing protein [Oscillatoriales cyanobacterium RM2_1_1]|nr:DUF928 domain-containing protein [Oscillatoriales cyanobacterium SM2_3_0]NJO46534.1 DUF928 domain-containing protein [Oscillatoriales cyanobacterium RM2_1_1]